MNDLNISELDLDPRPRPNEGVPFASRDLDDTLFAELLDDAARADAARADADDAHHDDAYRDDIGHDGYDDRTRDRDEAAREAETNRAETQTADTSGVHAHPVSLLSGDPAAQVAASATPTDTFADTGAAPATQVGMGTAPAAQAGMDAAPAIHTGTGAATESEAVMSNLLATGEPGISGNAAGVIQSADGLSSVLLTAENATLARRASTIDANQKFVAAKAQAGKAAATPQTSGTPATPEKGAAAQPGEPSAPRTEIARLDQAFRTAFSGQNATPVPVTPPAAPQAQPGLFTDAPAANFAGEAADANNQLQSAGAERSNPAATARAAATRPVFTLPSGRPAEQVSVQIQNAARDGADRIQIRLSPASLGKVDVSLELAPDKTVQAVVTAEKAETLDMLERDARTLQRALEEAGLRTNSDSLSFQHRDSGQSGDSNQDAASARDGASDDGDHATGRDDTAGTGDAETHTRRQHDGLLDLEV